MNFDFKMDAEKDFKAASPKMKTETLDCLSEDGKFKISKLRLKVILAKFSLV